MSRSLALIALLISLLISAFCAAPFAAAAAAPLTGVRYEQRIGAELPANATFLDENGMPHPLDFYEHGAPLIVVFSYFGCPNLCTLVFNGLVKALKKMPDQLGRDYRILSVSINPSESPRLALAKRRTYLAELGLVSAPWSFLTGREPEIRRLTNAAGFHYTKDPRSGEYSHPSGILIASPEGRITKYLMGIDFDPGQLHGALADARQGRLGTLVNEVLLYCFHYDPARSANGPLVMKLIRTTGAAGAFALFFFLGWLYRTEERV